MVETELYEPIRRWLEGQGYAVSAEVGFCDVVAYPPDDPQSLIVVELKRRMSLDLLAQAALRKELTDAVYVAVPLQGSRSRLRNGRALRTLLRRLETGLIVVRFLRGITRVEVLLHPLPFRHRTAHKRRGRIIREIDGRFAEFDKAGQPGSTPRLSAWRQRSLLVALILRECDSSSPADLRARGAPEQTQRILSLNSYGWFERLRHGVYGLSAAGRAALEILPEETGQLLSDSRLFKGPSER
ncbi:MAG: hypothetical protein EA427_06640 [Spirochaetaceae bacterium]|nr:MAG: hypothetical protein EA427_06640 [Spirochaetaceae bacterium]